MLILELYGNGWPVFFVQVAAAVAVVQ
jgi:hypothetical protein